MAEKQNKDDDEGKKKKGKAAKGASTAAMGIMAILMPFLPIILIIVILFTIIQGIIDIVVGIVNGIMDLITNPIATIVKIAKGVSNGLSYLFDGESWTPEVDPCEFTIILEEEQVEQMKEQITEQAIDLQKASLTDIVIKKMMLVNYMTITTSDTEVGIPISKEDYDNRTNSNTFSYWEGDDNKGLRGQYYMSTHGIVHLQDENGEKIYGYNGKGGSREGETDFEHFINTYDYDMQHDKKNTARAVLRAMQYAYTIDNIGTITMYVPHSQIVKKEYLCAEEIIYSDYSSSDTTVNTITINYLENIGPYVMPMDFLVSLLEITASEDFIEAVCDLVNDEKIIMVISADETVTIKQTSTRFADDIIAYGIEKEHDTLDEQEVSEKLSCQESMPNGDDWNIEKSETTISTNTDYKVFIKYAKTWYGEIEYDYNVLKKKKTITIDENGEEITNEDNLQETGTYFLGSSGSLGNVIQDMDFTRIWVNQDENETRENVFANDFDDAITKENLFNRYNSEGDPDKKAALSLIKKLDTKKNFFKMEDIKVADLQNNSLYGPKLTRVEEKLYNAKTSEITAIISKEVSNYSNVKNSVDRTDRFLGLLKNDTGSYVKGALFNSSGKKVYYKDVYKDTKEISAGDFLVNGSGALIQFMESASQYSEKLASVMKYILYRYTNEDYGVTSFNELIDWINSKNFTSISAGSAEECLSKMMASYEGLTKTSDGKKYLLLDGYNNDKFYSISTAYGFMFYAEGYMGYEHEDAINQAYKDCGMNDMTLGKAIGDLINSDGTINTSQNVNNAYPEKYALPIEVVDRAHVIRISELAARNRNLLDEYNKRTGKKVELTDEQICALVDAGWQYGSFNPAEFIEAYGNLGENPSESEIDSVLNQFLPFYDPKYSPGRPQARCKLFKEGTFTLSDGTELKATDFGSASPSAENIVKVAKQIVDATKLGGMEQTVYEGSRKSEGYSSNIYVCASFVSEVLYKSTGLKNWSDDVYTLGSILFNNPDYELIYYTSSSANKSEVGEFSGNINTNAKIEDIIQPGDVVATFSSDWRYQHVLIYIGQNQYAHHGSGDGYLNYPNISSEFLSKHTNSNVKYIFRYKK